MEMNKNVFLLDGYAVTCEIYCEGGKPWVYIATEHSSGVRFSGMKFPITCIADVERELGKVLVDIVQREEAQAEGE